MHRGAERLPGIFAGEFDLDGDGSPDTEDCDDHNATAHPGAVEACDGVDNDCDGDVDEAGARGEALFFVDRDQDGYGDVRAFVYACEAPSGHVSTHTDCGDTDSSVYPGAIDAWYDHVDADCAGNDDYDADGDGFSSEDHGGTDCDDQDPHIHPREPSDPSFGTPADCHTLAADDTGAPDDDRIEDDANADTDTDGEDGATGGGKGSGCSQSAGASGSALWLAVVWPALVWRRRRGHATRGGRPVP